MVLHYAAFRCRRELSFDAESPHPTQNSGTAALRFTLIDWRMVEPVLPAISTLLLPFLLPALFLFFALFAAVTHGQSSFSV
jgi:hypothetical protein